jgi:DnaJ-class molecular chaperone
MADQIAFRTCTKCNGSGEVADPGKITMGILSVGASLLVDGALGDRIATRACPLCGGGGQIVASVTTTERSQSNG